MKVLVVDDDRDVSLLLRTELEELGHEVSEAEDGEAGWTQASVVYHPVVLVDLEMPRLNGLELTRRIRTLKKYSYVIMLTAHSARADHMRGLDAGVDDFLAKPADIDMIGARLKVAERVLGLKRRVTHLEGLLPLCSDCKSIRRKDGVWVRLEEYFVDAEFSHGYCGECEAKAHARAAEERSPKR